MVHNSPLENRNEIGARTKQGRRQRTQGPQGPPIQFPRWNTDSYLSLYTKQEGDTKIDVAEHVLWPGSYGTVSANPINNPLGINEHEWVALDPCALS